MKKIIPIILILAVIGGGIVWRKKHATAKPTVVAPGEPPEEETKVAHDEQGHTVIHISDEAQGDAGITVGKPTAAQFAPELKGYGRALDPAPLALLMAEIIAAQPAIVASSNELARLKTLEAQGNASTRAVQTAEAATLRDQLALQAAKDRLSLAWGKIISERPDLPAFIQALASQESVLVRVDLSPGDSLKSPPTGARLVALSGGSADAEYLGMANNVDPQMQGRGLLFLLKSNTLRLSPGEALTAWMKLPGEPLSGVIIPRDAVVRTEGAGWVYVLMDGSASFTRTAIALDHPADNGWFTTSGVTATNYVVVSGAQTLLSEELKATIQAE